MATTLVNGKSYDYTQVEINILGVPVAGVTSITYTEEQEKTNNFGTGKRPVSRGRGPVDCSGTIEISMNDVENIRDAITDGSMLDIPSFDIPVTFGNSQKVVTHVVKNVEFTTDGVDTSQGDTDIKFSFDFVASNVKYR